MPDIGKRIKEKRIELGITQENLASKLGYKSKTTIAKIENGTNDITQSRVVDFANALNTTPSYLMGWEMSDEKQKKIFSRNLAYYLEKSGKKQKEVAQAIGVIPQTFNTWYTGQSIPRIGSIQSLADYFGIGKSDLIEEKSDQPIKLNKKMRKILQND